MSDVTFLSCLCPWQLLPPCFANSVCVHVQLLQENITQRAVEAIFLRLYIPHRNRILHCSHLRLYTEDIQHSKCSNTLTRKHAYTLYKYTISNTLTYRMTYAKTVSYSHTISIVFVYLIRFQRSLSQCVMDFHQRNINLLCTVLLLLFRSHCFPQ